MKIINCYCNKNKDIKLFKKRLKQIKKVKMRYMFVSIFNSKNKTKFLRKHDIFGEMGNNVLFQPMKLPNNPKLIKIHNNVKIAADVTFFEHDVINDVFAAKYHNEFIGHMSCIEIFDNCFIGGKSIIVGNVKIGPNAIVAAGSVVTKDVPEGSIVGGNPARVIGSFEKLYDKRQEDISKDDKRLLQRYEELWNSFYKE